MASQYIGMVLDERYRIIRALGEGGTGEVLLGQDVSNGQSVAVKVLHSELAQKEENLKRFFREAKAAAEISHENTIKVLDVGLTPTGEPFMVLEYLEGESLADYMRRTGPLPLKAACDIVEPVLLALATMHAKGILHRDIKPKKIYLVRQAGGPPVVKLLDFGLSKFTEDLDEANLTVAGASLGSFAYIAPEQVTNASEVNHLADLYSVGTVLYELLTGKLPFDYVARDQQILKKVTGEPLAPVEAYEGFPMAAESLVLQVLSREPSIRPQSAREMIADLRGIKNSPPVAVGTTTTSAGAKAAAGVPAASDGKTLPARAKELWEKIPGPAYVRYGGAGLLALLLVIGLVSSSGGTDPEPAPVPAVGATTPGTGAPAVAQAPALPAPAPKPKNVQIEVRGIPLGAKIYYNGAPVPMNPFQVELKEVIVPLRIEAAGYEAYATSLVPVEDQVVKVDLKEKAALPVPPVDTDTAASATAGLPDGGAVQPAPAPAKPAPAKRPAKRRKKKKKSTGFNFASEY